METGFYDLPFEEYLKTPAISSHALMDILKSPKTYHYKHIRGVKEEPTAAMKFGTLVHTAILEPDEFLVRYKIKPQCDRRTKEGKAIMADFESFLAPGSIVLDQSEADTLLGMIESLRGHKRANAVLQKGVAEQSGFFEHKSGRKCRIRPDFLTENGVLVDLKTTVDARMEPFSRAIVNYFYHLQIAFYIDGIKAITGKDVRPVFLAIEKTAPFEVGLYVPDATVIETGRILYERALKILDRCEQSGVYPGISDSFQSISIPPWAINKFEFLDGDEE